MQNNNSNKLKENITSFINIKKEQKRFSNYKTRRNKANRNCCNILFNCFK